MKVSYGRDFHRSRLSPKKPNRRLKEISEEKRGKCDVRITSVTFHSVGLK